MPTPTTGRKGGSARALRGALRVGGVVATIAGLDGMRAGARAVPGISEPADPVLESEFRFFTAFYAAYGLLMLSVAPRADRDAAAVNGLAGALFLAGLGRAAAWVSVGRPNRTQQGLLAIELGAPPALAIWRRRLG
jgi:hypothetical protein